MRQNKKGFTLLELVVVICLIAVIAGFTVPGIVNAVPGISLKSAANNLLSDMRLARSLAVKNQETVTMSFDTDSGSYQITSDTFSKTVKLCEYKGGIKFGAGMATKKASTGAEKFPEDYNYVSFIDEKIEFTRNGMCNKWGYVYLCNEKKDMGYAIGVKSYAGVVVFKKTESENSWATL